MSVLLPVYNCGQYVAKAIESILQQTYTNIELLILNDASTDNSDEVIRQFSDTRIRYISFETNTRKIGIVNHALTQVKGELVAFQDADDWSDKQRIEKQVSSFSDKEVVICFTGYSINGTAKNESSYRTTDELLRKEFHELAFLNPGHYNPTVCATMMFRSSVIEKEKGYSEWFTGKVGEDLHLVYRIMKHGKAVTIPQSLYFYNYSRPGSFTQQQSASLNPDSLYSYTALARLIEQDIQLGVDVLNTYDKEQLLQFELSVCKEALVSCHQKALKQMSDYESSLSLRLGRLVLLPFRPVLKYIGSKK